jgi:hypothetical protein
MPPSDMDLWIKDSTDLIYLKYVHRFERWHPIRDQTAKLEEQLTRCKVIT